MEATTGPAVTDSESQSEAQIHERRPPRLVAVVGLGAMGGPLARHLLRAGLPVAVRDHDAVRVQALVAEGAVDLDADRDGSEGALSQAGAVLVVVPSDADVRAAALDSGLLTALSAGAVLAVCSSVHPETVRELAAAAPTGVDVLDAALTGGVRAAEDGTINLLVGGPATALSRVRWALAPWTASVHHLGPHGAGQIAKTANNLVHWAQIAAIAEALSLARAWGLDVPTVRRALMDGPTDSRTLRELERMRLTWWRKDLDTADALGDELEMDLPVAKMCRDVMAHTTVDGLAELLRARPDGRS
ncbi:MAG: NAD(P)-dependent oxidoreductase [Actinomycetales bacterium]